LFDSLFAIIVVRPPWLQPLPNFHYNNKKKKEEGFFFSSIFR